MKIVFFISKYIMDENKFRMFCRMNANNIIKNNIAISGWLGDELKF